MWVRSSPDVFFWRVSFKKSGGAGYRSLCLTHAKMRSTIWATPPLPCAHRDVQNPCSNPVMESFFANLPECHPPSRIMRFLQKMSFCSPNSETQTFRQVQCAEPWWLACVVIPEAVTEKSDFLVPKIHCLNKLRYKSRTEIDCVGFYACESAVSR